MTPVVNHGVKKERKNDSKSFTAGISSPFLKPASSSMIYDSLCLMLLDT